MAEQVSQERTEAPTQRRRDEARGRGQVAISGDIGQAILLLTGITLLWFLSARIAKTLILITRHELLGLAYKDWTAQHTVLLVRAILGQVAEAMLPMLGIMLGVAIGVGAVQVGLRITFEPLGINWSRLSLTKGWDRIFSIRSVMRGVMVLLKLGLGVGVIAGFVWSKRQTIAFLGRQSLAASVIDTWTQGLELSLVLGGMLLVIGGLDYFFQRWQHEQDLKMSRQEIRDEHKREDGDPQVKGRMRKMARETLKMRMLKRVPEAAVVLTNPTHIAVALQYDRDSMEAPRVIAKGTGAFAKRIVAIAKDNRIPVLERKPLARALYATVDVDQEIPSNLYRAIAEILAHIYGLGRAA